MVRPSGTEERSDGIVHRIPLHFMHLSKATDPENIKFRRHDFLRVLPRTTDNQLKSVPFCGSFAPRAVSTGATVPLESR